MSSPFFLDLGGESSSPDGRGRIFQMASSMIQLVKSMVFFAGEIHRFFFGMLVMLVMLISHKVSTSPMENHHS